MLSDETLVRTVVGEESAAVWDFLHGHEPALGYLIGAARQAALLAGDEFDDDRAKRIGPLLAAHILREARDAE